LKFDQTRMLIRLDKELTKLIMTSRNISELEALEIFLNSETYQMILDPELRMWEFAPLAIFDMWENEIANGDPRESLYIRGDEIG